jgi:hypothetical protein
MEGRGVAKAAVRGTGGRPVSEAVIGARYKARDRNANRQKVKKAFSDQRDGA